MYYWQIHCIELLREQCNKIKNTNIEQMKWNENLIYDNSISKQWRKDKFLNDLFRQLDSFQEKKKTESFLLMRYCQLFNES